MNRAKTILTIILFTFNAAHAINGGVGIKTGLSGGPLFGVVGILQFTESYSMNIAVDGFPGIIFRGESNLRYTLGGKWSPHIQAGTGFYRLYQGQYEGHNINELHFYAGISRPFGSQFIITFSGGLLYTPYGLNSFIEEEDRVDVPLAPGLEVEVVYYFKE